MSPNIRKMELDDWNEFHVHDIEIFPDDSIQEAGFESLLERNECFVLEDKDEMVGHLCISRFGENESHLARIGVSKKHQRKGYGKLLMQHALDWFNNQGDIVKVHLYTQHDNHAAQSLYKQFGFSTVGTTWHYFVPFETLKPTGVFTCQKLQKDEIEHAGQLYPSLPAVQIERFLSRDEYLVLTVKDRDGVIQGVARFTPSFPGSFPFEISTIDGFDDFLLGMKEFSLPEYDYVRVTFTDNHELAELCASREYRLHHKLFKMSHVLKK